MSNFTGPPSIWYTERPMPFEPLRGLPRTHLVTNTELFENHSSHLFMCNNWCRNNNYPYFIAPDAVGNDLAISQPLVIRNRQPGDVRSNGQPHESDDLPMQRPVSRREVVHHFRRCFHLDRFLREHDGTAEAPFKFRAAFLPDTAYPEDQYTYAAPFALLLVSGPVDASNNEVATYAVTPEQYVSSLRHGVVNYGEASRKPSCAHRLTIKHNTGGDPGTLWRAVWTSTHIPPLWDTVVAFNKMSTEDRTSFLSKFEYTENSDFRLEAAYLEYAIPYDDLSIHFAQHGTDDAFSAGLKLQRLYTGMRSIFTSSVLVNMVQKASELPDPGSFAKCIKSQCNPGTEDMLSRYGPDSFVQVYSILSDNGFPDLDDIADSDNAHACRDLDCGGCTCCEALSRVSELEEIISDAKCRLDDA